MYISQFVTIDTVLHHVTVNLTHVYTAYCKEYIIPGPTVTCVEALWNSRLLYQQPHM